MAARGIGLATSTHNVSFFKFADHTPINCGTCIIYHYGKRHCRTRQIAQVVCIRSKLYYQMALKMSVNQHLNGAQGFRQHSGFQTCDWEQWWLLVALTKHVASIVHESFLIDFRENTVRHAVSKHQRWLHLLSDLHVCKLSPSREVADANQIACHDLESKQNEGN